MLGTFFYLHIISLSCSYLFDTTILYRFSVFLSLYNKKRIYSFLSFNTKNITTPVQYNSFLYNLFAFCQSVYKSQSVNIDTFLELSL
jgi:hypothetical protein